MNQEQLDTLKMSAKISKLYFRTKEEARQTLLDMCNEHNIADVIVVDKIMKEVYK